MKNLMGIARIRASVDMDLNNPFAASAFERLAELS